jgi:hypothetical protein
MRGANPTASFHKKWVSWNTRNLVCYCCIDAPSFKEQKKDNSNLVCYCLHARRMHRTADLTAGSLSICTPVGAQQTPQGLCGCPGTIKQADRKQFWRESSLKKRKKLGRAGAGWPQMSNLDLQQPNLTFNDRGVGLVTRELFRR